ncbi:hypothetical protein VTH06DRAFT_6322 [Thermothelomyces fergusii]
MLDVNDFIVERGGNPDKIRESQRKRYAPVEAVDEVIAMWEDHRRTAYAATQLNAKINEVQKQIGPKKKAKEDVTDLLKQKADLEKEKKDLLALAAEKEKALKAKVKTIGNIVHESVPVSDNEDNNTVERTWAPEGVTFEKRNVLSHHEVLEKLDGYDPERGVKVVGHRGYFLRQWGVFLNQALINYGLEFLNERGYIPLQTPQLMLKDQMAKTAQLSQFDEELYKVTGDQSDKYLIATSEQPISAFHSDEWLQPKQLPLKYAGYSTCFRKEAGAHGKDVWGIFRVHEFTKVEQFCITDPEKSWEMFESMISTSEEFYKSLGIPYRVVAIVSGALNNAAAKKLDLEAWFPHQGEFKELVSCSNCTDYQSRDLEIRFGVKKQTDIKKTYVHCLNSTLTATTRTLCAILENFQTEDGVRIPEPLRKYLPGAPDFIPFAKKDAEKKEGEKKEVPQALFERASFAFFQAGICRDRTALSYRRPIVGCRTTPIQRRSSPCVSQSLSLGGNVTENRASRSCRTPHHPYIERQPLTQPYKPSLVLRETIANLASLVLSRQVPAYAPCDAVPRLGKRGQTKIRKMSGPRRDPELPRKKEIRRKKEAITNPIKAIHPKSSREVPSEKTYKWSNQAYAVCRPVFPLLFAVQPSSSFPPSLHIFSSSLL